MADRNQRNRRPGDNRDTDYHGSRQAEQFDDTFFDRPNDSEQRDRFNGGQMGEGRGSRPAGGIYYEEETRGIPSRSRGSGGGQGYDDYRNSGNYAGGDAMSGGGSRSENSYGRGFQPPIGENRGGRDFMRGQGRSQSGSGAGYRGDYDDHDRGFFERAGDEIASWFGDEDASRRRQQDHSGSGPSNYTRSDERILEDACDNLTDDWQVDARNIQVTVKDGEVTLDGTVDDRGAKRRAEDCVDCISGVKHVQNNLRLQDRIGEDAGYPARQGELDKS